MTKVIGRIDQIIKEGVHMLLSDVAELYNLLIEYKNSTADYMVSLTKGNWTIAEGGYGRMWELYYGAEKKPTAYAENGVIIVDHAQNTVTKKEIEKIIKSVLDYLK